MVRAVHLGAVNQIYRDWLAGLDASAERVDDLLNIFDQVSPSVVTRFVEGLRVTEFKYRYDDSNLLLKIKLELFEKFFTFNMHQLITKIVASLTPDTITVLLTGRPEPAAVICQRIVVRQYAVINQRVEKRLQSFTDQSKFSHCDICGKYSLDEALELLAQSTMQSMVANGFHPHNSESIVAKLAKRNKVAPSVITQQQHTLKWLEFVQDTQDQWRVCDECLLEMKPFYDSD